MMARGRIEIEEKRRGERELKKAYGFIYKYNTRTQICKPLRRWKLTTRKNTPAWHPTSLACYGLYKTLATDQASASRFHTVNKNTLVCVG